MGARGPAGPQGATGEPGPAGRSGYLSGGFVLFLTLEDGSSRPAFLPLSGWALTSATSYAIVAAQPVPQTTTITAIRLRIVPTVQVPLGDHSLQPTVAVLVNDAVAAVCAPPPLTGVVEGDVAITATCPSLSVPLAAGDAVALRVAATAIGEGSLLHEMLAVTSVALTTS